MGSRYTKYDLERVTDYLEFESFCHTLMSRVGYDNIEPLGGFGDKGRDAIHVSRLSGEITIFAYSVPEDWNKKLNEDLGKIRRQGHKCDSIAFITTASLTAGEKDHSKDSVHKDYGWSLEIYDLERISTLVDGPHQDLIRMHPGIFPPSLRDAHAGSREAQKGPGLHPGSPRIFISYARRDGQKFADPLRRRLEDAGFAIWQDIASMEGGRDWWEQISKKPSSRSNTW